MREKKNEREFLLCLIYSIHGLTIYDNDDARQSNQTKL